MPERLAEVFVVVVDAELAGDVENAEEPEHGVGGKAHRILHREFGLALQHVVDRRPGIGGVVEDVADAAPHELRHHLGIAGGNGLQKVLVKRFVEREDLAVPVLPGIEPRAGAAAGLGQRRAPAERKQHAEQHRDGPTRSPRAQHHFLTPLADVDGASGAAGEPASAALLKRNWLIRLSSTTADCVCVIVSPEAKTLSCAPASIPTY